MSGKKPSTTPKGLIVGPTDLHIIVRGFRGAQLVLVSYSRTNNTFAWANAIGNHHKALKLPAGEALKIADRAAREYGAKCATLSADGTLVEPEASRLRGRITLALVYVRSLLSEGRCDNLSDALIDARRVYKLSTSEVRTVRDFYESGME